MTVLTFATGDKFIYRVIKSLTTNPSNKWANTYEFKALAGGVEAVLLALGTALVDFEIAISRDTVQFDRLTISTWEPDSVPYDPATFISTTLTGNGAVGPVGDNLPLNQCLVVTRQCASGRFGHLFYRGVLNEADTEAPAGTLILTDRSGQQDNIDAALTSSGLDAYIGALPDADMGMVMINADGTQVRSVINLRVQGATTLPTDHAWFNRT